METIAKIRRMHRVEHKPIKAIARELGISKNTVRKVIRSEATKFELAKYSKAKPVLGEYVEILRQLLEENRKEPSRRRMTGKKIYEEIRKIGYKGSYETVNLVVREYRREEESKGRQVFIPLDFEAGQAFQFDWGTEEVSVGGRITKVKAARIKLCYSRYSLVVVYPNEQLEMVMAAHEEAFKFFGGCCKSGIYDNMKTAVKKILIGKDRILNEQFAQMASHYLFEPIACTPGSGWEKGQVEKQVGDTRRNFFTPMLQGDSYEAINSKLREMSIEWAKTRKHPEFKERTILELYEEEKSHLIEYRGEFKGYRLHPKLVSPLSLVQYDSNMYSVPCEYVGLGVQIKSYAWEIIILHEEKVISKHARCFGRHQRIYNPWHYISALERKPGALRNGAPFKELMTLLPEIFYKIRSRLEAYKDGDKQFIAILQFVNRYGLDRVRDACDLAVSAGGCSARLVEQYLHPSVLLESEADEFIQLKDPPDADCGIYSKLYLSEEDKK